MDDMVEQPPLQRSRTERPARPQVVIVGAGFGGLSAALKLRHIVGRGPRACRQSRNGYGPGGRLDEFAAVQHAFSPAYPRIFG
jgi:glycine/D-amino acid oxidase-like deaminating enzyme